MFEDLINDDDSPNTMNRRLEEVPKTARKDKYNPTINREQHQKKKYSFFRNRRMPLWTSIYAINKQVTDRSAFDERFFLFFNITNLSLSATPSSSSSVKNMIVSSFLMQPTFLQNVKVMGSKDSLPCSVITSVPEATRLNWDIPCGKMPW